MTTEQMIHLADLLANDLVTFGGDQGLTAHDLLMVTAMAERLLQTVVAPQNPTAVLRAMQEAEATFVAVSMDLEMN